LALRNLAGEEKITLDGNGDSYFSGAMTIGLNGGIWQGAGSFASPTTGLKIYNTGGVGRLSAYNAGQEQITINTAGQLAAGQGKVVLDRFGLSMISAEDDWSGRAALTWKTTGGVTFAAMMATELENGHGYLKLGTVYTRSGLPAGTPAVHGLEIDENSIGPIRTIALNSLGSLTLYGRQAIYIRSGQTANAPIYLYGDTTANGNFAMSVGLALGDTTMTPPAAGRILMKQSTGATTVPAGAALIFLENQANNKQALWIRFDDGTYVKLAESAT